MSQRVRRQRTEIPCSGLNMTIWRSRLPVVVNCLYQTLPLPDGVRVHQ